MTWNLNGQQRARNALLEDLRQRQMVGVAAIQEWVAYGTDMPSLAQLQQDVLRGTSGRFAVAVVADRLVVIYHVGLRVTLPRQSPRLASVTVADAGRWCALRVVAVHARSRLYADRDEDRKYHMHELVRDIQEHWCGGPAIVLGDFNAHPYEAELSSKSGLGAFPHRREVVHFDARRQNGPGLWNPSWRFLVDPESDNVPAGTIYHTTTARGVSWCSYDQIMVSRELAAVWSSRATLQLKPQLSGHDNLRNGRPRDSKVFSDHVPVELSFPLEEVPECQI